MREAPQTIPFGHASWIPAVWALLVLGCVEDPRLTPPRHEGGVVDMAVDSGVADVDPCLIEEECPLGQYCDIADGDFSGVCADGCNHTDDCVAAQVCDVEAHVCRPPPCTRDAECPNGRCAQGECVASACSRVRPCPPSRFDRAQRCNEDDGTCDPLFVCCDLGACSMARDGECGGGMQLDAPLTCDANPCFEGCRDDNDCPDDGTICESGDCVSDPGFGSCRTDDDCAVDGETCEAGACVFGRCAPGDLDPCGPDTYCDPISEFCRENCNEHDDCEDNEACNAANRQCEISECRDDQGEGGEPNNDEASATIIELVRNLDGVRSGRAEGQVLCGDDVDVFSVTLELGERMRVRVVFHENDDLDFRLSGEQVGDEPVVVATRESPEETVFPADPGDIRHEATYFITVIPGRASDAGIIYSVFIDIVPIDGLLCFADALEDDDSPQTATAIGDANPYAAPNLNLCPGGDEDWFRVPLSRDDGLHIEVTAHEAEPPMTIALFSQDRIDNGGEPEYADVMAVNRAGSTVYILDLEARAGAFSDGQWYIRVRSSDPEALTHYHFNVRRSFACEDGYEENDQVDTGTELARLPGVGVNGEVPYSDDGVEVPSPDNDPLQLCRFDDDVYCLDLAAGDGLDAWAHGELAGEARVRIVDADGREVGAQGLLVREVANPIPAQLIGAHPGRYCVVVDGQGPAQGAYRLWIRRIEAPDLCVQDPELANGRNDTPNTATALIDVEPNRAPNRRFEYRNALICGDEDDWYTFPVVAPDSRVCVMVDGFEHDRANIDVELYGPGGAEPPALGVSLSAYNAEHINQSRQTIGEAIGDYTVRVYRPEGDDAAYRVLATVTPDDEVCGPDWQERLNGPNGNGAQAINLGRSHVSICDTWLCHDGDDDDYRITVPAGEDRTIFVEYDPETDGRIFMDVIGNELNGDPDFGGFRRSAEAQPHQCINIRGGAQNQEVVIRLFANLALEDGDDRVDYSLRVVPTDLAGLTPQHLMEQGACVTLGAADQGSCPIGDPFAGGCWPHLTLE